MVEGLYIGILYAISLPNIQTVVCRTDSLLSEMRGLILLVEFLALLTGILKLAPLNYHFSEFHNLLMIHVYTNLFLSIFSY